MLNRTLIGSAVSIALQMAEAEGAGIVDLDLARESANADMPETEETKAERKARLEALEASAKKDANDGTALPDELVGLAQREIHECWREFANKGGVWDLRMKVRDKLSNISKHILNIARECAKAALSRSAADPNADYVKLAGRMFRNAMAQAESSLRAKLDLADDNAEAKLDAFLSGSWNVYKSQCKTAFDAGFDPQNFESIYGFKKAADDAKAAKNGGGEGKGRKAKEREDVDETTGMSADTPEDEPDTDLASYVINVQYAKGHAALSLLLATLGTADWDKHEDKIVNLLNLANKEITKLHPAEKPMQAQGQPAHAGAPQAAQA